MKNGLWSGAPGEWIFFATDTSPVAFYGSLSSVKRFGDYAVYTARYPLPPTDPNTTPQGAYVDDTTVLDCKNSTSVWIERATYNKTGDVTYRYKWASQEFFQARCRPTQIQPGTILSLAAPIICDEEMRRPLLLRDEIKQNKLSPLTMTFPPGMASCSMERRSQLTSRISISKFLSSKRTFKIGDLATTFRERRLLVCSRMAIERLSKRCS